MADDNGTSGGGPAKKASGGVLRKPKYSAQVVPATGSTGTGAGMSSIISSAYPIAEGDDGVGNDEFVEDQVPVVRPLIRDLVVERDPKLVQRQQAAAAITAAPSPHSAPPSGAVASAIEGYVPVTGNAASGDGSNAAVGTSGATIISIPPNPSASVPGGVSPEMMSAAQPPAPPPSSSSSVSNKPKSAGPTVIKSISQLVALAQGTSEEAAEGIDVADIRRRQEAGEEVALETDMAFSCMTEEEYKETVDMAKKMTIGGDTNSTSGDATDQKIDGDDDDDGDNEQEEEGITDTDFEEGCMLNMGSDEPTLEEVFFGRQQPIFGDDTDDLDDSENESRMSEYEGDGGTHRGGGGGGSGFMDFFGADEDDSVGEPEPAPKAFILLWNAMSSWITPETTTQIQEWQAEQEAAGGDAAALIPSSTLRQPYDLSDIGASRCGGLMSMIKMHLPRALEELGYNKSDGHVRRLAQPILFERSTLPTHRPNSIATFGGH